MELDNMSNDHLSLSARTCLSVLGSDYSVQKRVITDLIGEQRVYDWFGNIVKIHVEKGAEEQKIMTTSTSGEMIHFGESHSVLVKDANSIWSRKKLSEIETAVSVKLPQKKIVPRNGMLQYLDIDEKGLFLLVEKVSDFGAMLKAMAFCGVKVNRHPAVLRIDLDRSKPPCFATKLLNGSFIYNLENTIGSLTMGGVINPCALLSPSFFELIQTSGIIFEGANIFNEVSLLPPQTLATKMDTYYVYIEDSMTPVELDWFCS
jgi:hypothetical protein